MLWSGFARLFRFDVYLVRNFFLLFLELSRLSLPVFNLRRHLLNLFLLVLYLLRPVLQCCAKAQVLRLYLRYCSFGRILGVTWIKWLWCRLTYLADK